MADRPARTAPLPSRRALPRIAAVFATVIVATALTQPRAEAVGREDVGAGMLLQRTDSGLLPLPMADLRIDLRVTGVMLRGRVTQTFHNPGSAVIDAVYVFPLPDRAAVHRMELAIGDRRIVSEVQEKERARATYERARAEGRKSALVDQQLGNLWTAAAANINPGETVSIVLEYLEEAAWEDGAFHLRFPLAYTPRFTPPDAGPLPALAPGSRGPLPRARLAVAIDLGSHVEAITSDSHAIDVELRGTAAHVTTVPAEIVADRDFVLRWKAAGDEWPAAQLLVEDRDDGRYGLLMVLPPAAAGEVGEGLPTETLFVVDVSGSMEGPSIRQARAALLAAFDRLRPEDRFNLIAFNEVQRPFSDGFQQADADALHAARRWVGGLAAGGGTMILPALERAMDLLGDSRGGAAQRIVLVTDGAVSNEDEVLSAIVERLGDARLHTLGIGQAPNGWLMRKLAWHGRGIAAFVADVDGAVNAIDRFFERLDRPVLTALEWQGAAPLEMHPDRLPDLYAGQPLILSVRLSSGALPERVIVRGHSRVGALERNAGIGAAPATEAGISVRWARAHVEAWIDRLHEGADPELVRGEIVETALAFGLVTAYTSRVAVEETPTATGDSREAHLGAALPSGGTDDGLRLAAGLCLAALGLAVWVALAPGGRVPSPWWRP